MIKKTVDALAAYFFVSIIMAGFMGLMFLSWRIDHTFYCR